MTSSVREMFEYGQSVRRVVAQPKTSLARAEDLSASASRLLRLRQLLGSADPELGKLIDACLADISAVHPDDAVRRFRAARQGHEHEAAYWALGCHLIADILCEYSRDASPQTISLLRESLPDWFGRFRETLEAKSRPLPEHSHVALQAFVAQCALFFDLDSLNWGQEQLLEALSPDRIGECDAEAASAALVAGLASIGVQDQARGRVKWVLGTAPDSLAVRELHDLAGVERPKVQAETAERPKDISRSSRTRPGAHRRKQPGGPVAAFLESIGPFIPWILALSVIGGCIWGAGSAWEWLLDTSPVGNQSLGEAYDRMAASNEQRRAAENAPLIPAEPDPAPRPLLASEVTPAAAATPAPSPTPAASPGPAATPEPAPTPDERTEALAQLAEQHSRWLAPAVRVRRTVTPVGQRLAPGMAPRRITMWGEFDRHEVMPAEPDGTARVRYHVTWFENDTEAGAQWIEGFYKWEDGGWQLTAAARCTRPDGPDGQPVYDLSDADVAWAAELFRRNPFYQ